MEINMTKRKAQPGPRSERDIEVNPIDMGSKKLAAVLAKDVTGKILANLYQHPYQSASDVARMLRIHIATAQKYLRELKEVHLIEARMRSGVSRPTEEYRISTSKIHIDIDIAKHVRDVESIGEKLYIRENKNMPIAYESDVKNRKITELLILDNINERVNIIQRIKLNDIESRFLWYVPYSSVEPRSVTEIMNKAGIAQNELSVIIKFVEKLSNLEVGGRLFRVLDVEDRANKPEKGVKKSG